jgi:hypothetical protein
MPAQPNRMLGVLGSHGSSGGSGDGDPVQALAYCAERQLFASAGLDDTVKSPPDRDVSSVGNMRRVSVWCGKWTVARHERQQLPAPVACRR